MLKQNFLKNTGLASWVIRCVDISITDVLFPDNISLSLKVCFELRGLVMLLGLQTSVVIL